MLLLTAVANSFSFCTVFNVTVPQFIIHSVVHGHLVCFFGSYEYSYMSFGAHMFDIYPGVKLFGHRYLYVQL